MIQQLAIVGLGLIGGSLARSLRAAGFVGKISAYDPDPVQGETALKLGVIDRVATSAVDAVSNADLVVLSVPVLHTEEAMRSLVPGLKPGTIVTDVGSTKQSVLRDVANACGGEVPAWFVAGHPIAGTEKSGVANSQPALFKGHRVILTPHTKQDLAAKAQVLAMWEACGARVVEMEPARHDAIFAATSHLPHLLAFSFVDMLDRLDHKHEIFPNAGGGFRDFTRIASSSPRMWHDIIKANKECVSELLGKQIEDLQQLQTLIAADRWDEVSHIFERARAAREHYLTQIE
ncbi:prephenate dehydrogenase [Stenotrophobium rhamnosiphilum]|uniref:Prephenate dehydrogenase/arogenate dehydrogenase family protein n=1 Tax=Stenotrophobium rhamnosiphilum TaxID=2029166 RepID=A0A2T5MET0_9GAMM|nr:prephenate dehydrogenase/arogenate dehydrogenase family protein [Stenotrophobium rhamnosiphilum]PTU31090.1 prephenate dehydrogenase/arogenate dehydrogenase family protein [Stenotrophobium rhamnosiphilum]